MNSLIEYKFNVDGFSLKVNRKINIHPSWRLRMIELKQRLVKVLISIAINQILNMILYL